MSGRELAGRVGAWLVDRTDAIHAVRMPPPSALPLGERWPVPDYLDLSELEHRARSVAEGSVSFLGVSDDEPSDSLRDPLSGNRAVTRLGRAGDVSSLGPGGSIKTLWDKNRHHHLVVAASGYRLTGDDSIAGFVRCQLEAWVDQNPPYRGVNWSSGIEIALRLVSWVWVERMLRGSGQHEALFGVEGLLWPSIWHSVRYLRLHPSRGSSRNNHRIAELLGQYVAGAAWDLWPDTPTLRSSAWNEFQREVELQTDESGFSREQAVGYHLFVTEMALCGLLEACLRGDDASPAFVRRVEAMTALCDRLADIGGNVADFGDADGSQVFGLFSSDRGRMPVVCALAERIIGQGSRLISEPERAVAGLIAADCARPSVPPTDAVASPTGLHVIRHGEQRQAVELWFDVAPLGMPPLAAHGHADALSVLLSLGGYPLLIDSGTYRFGASDAWRSYFRGSKAHNVVTVGGLDQSVSGGDFFWTKHATVRLSSGSTDGVTTCVEGVHDGYTRLDGVGAVKRRILVSEHRLDVTDTVEGKSVHDVACRWHIDSTWEVSLEGSGARLRLGSHDVRVALDPQLTWRVVRGAEREGWVSRSFNSKEPCTTLVGEARAQLPVELRCSFTWTQ